MDLITPDMLVFAACCLMPFIAHIVIGIWLVLRPPRGNSDFYDPNDL